MQAGAKYKQRYWEKGKEREEWLQIVSQPLATLGSNLHERNKSKKYTRQQRSVSRSSACVPLRKMQFSQHLQKMTLTTSSCVTKEHPQLQNII